MNPVIKKYLQAALLVALDLLIAWLLAVRVLVPCFSALTGETAGLVLFLLSLAGTGLLLMAGIGRLGWEIRTWDGQSGTEKLDQTLFLIFSLVGTFLLALDFFIVRSTK